MTQNLHEHKIKFLMKRNQQKIKNLFENQNVESEVKSYSRNNLLKYQKLMLNVPVKNKDHWRNLIKDNIINIAIIILPNKNFR